MNVEDKCISDEVFKDFLESMPQVCVEVIVESDEGILLCKRAVKPELWFWPGSRLYKGEELKAAAHRVAQEELSIDINFLEQLGIHSHFWQPDQVDEGVSRHTVNVVCRVAPTCPNYCINLNDQHIDYQFINENSTEFHEYVSEYIETYNLV